MGELSINKSRCVNRKFYWTLDRDRGYVSPIYFNLIILRVFKGDFNETNVIGWFIKK
jgi:hypothetical protein